MAESKVEDVVIVGAGPAGYTAAIYSARADLKPLMIEGFESGGQLMLTSDVENYPGFPEGVLGPDLMDTFRKQAERFGTRFIRKNVTSVDFSSRPLKLFIEEEEIQAKTVIIATGASAQWLGLESEQKLLGKGVSSCATCDGAFFKEEKLVVVGGGDTAMEDALFLTKFASSIKVIHRRDKLRASKIMQDRAFKNPKIEFIWDSTVDEVFGENAVEGVMVKNLKTGETQKLECAGLFVAIGHIPNTKFLGGQITVDEKGYLIQPNRPSTQTNILGVFAAGDVQDVVYRQAVTAAGSGCQAAIDSERYLESIEH